MLRTSPRLPIRSRLSAAWKSFRFPTTGGYAEGYGNWGSGSFFGGFLGLTPGSRYDYAKEVGPVWLNGVVLAAVNRFALLWNEAPLIVYRPRPGDKPEMLKEHPALTLLARPNEYYDDTRLWGSTLLSILTAGNGYWIKQPDATGRLAGLVYVPDFKIAPYRSRGGRDFISGFNYWVDGEKIPLQREEVVHLTWLVSDPMNDMKGLSPLAAELRAIAIDNEVANYTASILRNMGIPGVIIAPKDGETEVTPEQAELIKRLYVERFTGDSRGAPFVPSLPIDVHSPGYSPEQMALGSIVDQPVPRICGALQIDPMVLGYASPSKTYSNMEAALEAAYEMTLIPLHSAICSQMTEQIMPALVRDYPAEAADGDYFGRDYSEVRVLQEDQDKLALRLEKLVGGPILSRNEARAELGREDIEGGDELYPPKSSGFGGGGFGSEGQNPGQPALPRAASLPSALQKEIGEKWRRRRELAASGNGHG